jgi:P4 family phage/plasmid primase-like protien
VEGLREGAAQAGPTAAGYAEGEAMLSALLADDRVTCSEVAEALAQANLKLSDEAGSRHDSMLGPVLRLVMLGAHGHPGVGQALESLRERWGEMTSGEDREAEFDDFVLSGARKAVTEVGQAAPVAWDPCLMMAGGTPAVMPVADGVTVAPSTKAPHPWLTWIGAHPFDPKGGTDQALARAVLERVRPMLRFAAGTKGGWLLRGPTCWELDEDLTGRAITEVAELMPHGEPAPTNRKKDKYTDENWAAWRRSEFMSSAGSGRIERKIRSAVAGGMHPSTVKLADLDADPEVLWAGGWPWNLRSEFPDPARWIDPGTPHLRTAMCAPDPACPTPRWDAFVAAVWPDSEVRAWALRVLSVALTGYPDAVLPVLYGRERSGKTSVVEILVEVLGSYAHAASAKLLSSQDNAHPEIYWDLKGRRLSFIDEGPKRGHDATERLKQITGGGSLTGRAMQKNSLTFKPSHTLVMTTNDEPQLTDPALRARIRLIPCDAAESVVRPARIALLGNGLTAEAPGILAAMMREAAGYLANLDSASTAAAPTDIRGRALELAQAQDPAWEWVDNCTVAADPGTPGRALYTSFCRWHQASPVFRKLPMPTENAFGRSLTAKAILPKKTGGLSYRPLSVLTGAVGIAPWEPITEPYVTRGACPAQAGEDLGSIAGRIGRKSSTP